MLLQSFLGFPGPCRTASWRCSTSILALQLHVGCKQWHAVNDCARCALTTVMDFKSCTSRAGCCRLNSNTCACVQHLRNPVCRNDMYLILRLTHLGKLAPVVCIKGRPHQCCLVASTVV